MDFCGPYCTSTEGQRYVLVFVDQFTKMVELVPCGDQLSSTVAQCFYERIICRYGTPRALLSDRGPQFKSQLIELLCATFGVNKIFSSAYYPQGDGFAERFMRTMNNSLSVLCRSAPKTWDTFLPGLAFAYNVTEHAATGLTPFFLNSGRVPRFPRGGRATGGRPQKVKKTTPGTFSPSLPTAPPQAPAHGLDSRTSSLLRTGGSVVVV